MCIHYNETTLRHVAAIAAVDCFTKYWQMIVRNFVILLLHVPGISFWVSYKINTFLLFWMTVTKTDPYMYTTYEAPEL